MQTRSSSSATPWVVLLLVVACGVTGSCGGGDSTNSLPPGTVLDQFAGNTGGSALIPFGADDVQSRVVQLAQTFTVGVTGRLVALDLIAGGADSDLIVRIMPAPGGVIDPDVANAGFSTRILAFQVQPPGFGMFLTLSGGGLAVTAGDELAITLEHPDGAGMCLESSAAYGGGHSYERDNENVPAWTERSGGGDLFFATYVAP